VEELKHALQTIWLEESEADLALPIIAMFKPCLRSTARSTKVVRLDYFAAKMLKIFLTK